MSGEFVLASALVLYVLWNEFGRVALRKRLNSKNPLNGNGDLESRLREVELYINRTEARGRAEWAELQRTLARNANELIKLRESLRDSTRDLGNRLASDVGKMEAMEFRVQALESWRHGPTEIFTPPPDGG